MARTTETHIALAKIHGWITREGVQTGSARVLRDMLLSMAGMRAVKLFGLNTLDRERRAWLATVVRGFHEVTVEELLSAAGGQGGEEGPA